MVNLTNRFLVALVISFFVTLPNPTYAQVVSFSPAVDLLGQFDEKSLVDPQPFYNNKAVPHNRANRVGLNGPDGVTVDSVRHRLFVVDAQNNRVLVFNLTAGNALADLVPAHILGQTTFATRGNNTNQSTFTSPRGAAYDAARDRLFVSDPGNNRVMIFDTASITDGEAAINVLGHPNFTDTPPGGTTQNEFHSPGGLAIDSTGDRLYVADTTNLRVMIFDVSTVTNGEAAINVLGQPNFGSSGQNLSQNGLNSINSVALDDDGHRLFITDPTGHRVLVHDVSSGTISNGQNATNVLGQANFTSNSNSTTQTGMSYPVGAAYDADADRLFVAEGLSNRIKVYDAAMISNNEPAVNVLGQANFTASGGATTPSKFLAGTSTGLAFASGGFLYLGDQGSNRVMAFDVNVVNDGENAINLLGQFDGSSVSAPVPQYTKSGADDSPNRLGFNNPAGVEIDTVRHRLFVADRSINRVLVYGLTNDNLLIDRIPDSVLGQPDFVTSGSSTTQSTFNLPRGLAYDSARDLLFVADTTNRRVLVFDTATITNGEPAVNVLGQADYTSSSVGLTQSGFNTISDVEYDSTGKRLFVADASHSRVLVFDVTTISNNQAAVNVIGQVNFTTGSGATTQDRLNSPQALAYDPAGNRLFVADRSNHRVVVFDTSMLTNGPIATAVLGQANFTNNTAANTQSRMSSPAGIAYDAGSTLLYVGQGGNNRVTTYDVAAITNGENAVHVLGQASFFDSASGTVRTDLNNPAGLAFDSTSGRLYVAEESNNRVSVFAASSGLTYTPGTFTESNLNDGSLPTVVAVKLRNDDFTIENGVMTASTHYTIANLPAGLTAVVTGTSRTTATIVLNGNAVSNTNGDDVLNVTITFLNAAFVTRTASLNANSSKNDLVIDFADLPTPTPTTTATPTSTHTPTATPTNTPVPPTPTASATSVPPAAPTDAPTPIPSVTPTTEATPTAIATPTTAPGQVRGQVVVDGQPLAGALVYSELGIVTTDANGNFTFEGAESGVTYTVFVQRSGVLFPSGTVTAGAGQFTQVVGTSRPFNSKQCAENDVSQTLLSAGGLAADQRDRVEDSLAEIRQGRSTIENRVLGQFSGYLSASRRIPDVILDCSGIAECPRTDYSTAKERLGKRLNDLRREALSVNRTLREAGKRSLKQSESFSRTVTRSNLRAKKLVRGIPRNGDECS